MSGSQGEITLALSAAQRTALSKNKDAAIRERVAKLLGAVADGDRMKAYEASKAVLGLTPNAAHGREVFKAVCCDGHRVTLALIVAHQHGAGL